MSVRNEQIYFDALRRISAYMSPEQLRRKCQRTYGLEYEEALEYAYENVLDEARVIKGKRRPSGAAPIQVGGKPQL